MFYRFLMVLALCTVSHMAVAEFNYEGNGTLKYPTGVETPFSFGFAFNKTGSGHKFKAGQYEMEVGQVPDKYSIWIAMVEDKNVYVQEFAGGYFEGFEWQLGEHSVSLKKKVLSPKRALGDYVLTVNGIDYFFKGKQGAIEILFDENGISSIEANSFIKDLGMSE